MHLFRLGLAVPLGMHMFAAASAARAEDSWSPAFADVRASAQAKPSLSPKPYWKPVASTWRTIVVPDTQPEAAPQIEAARITPALARTPTTSLAPDAKTLTGYAHELAGLASYYWQEQMTSSGERFDKRAMTAAHKTLPIGTRVKVTNLTNGKSTIVRINDRGPFKPGRVIDLSEAAAEQISMTGAGLARVAIEVVR